MENMINFNDMTMPGENSRDKTLLANLPVEVFLERLGSGMPTPGGGATAALDAAQGAALVMMVANHTIGKKKYAEYEELNVRVRDDAEELLEELMGGIDKDAFAFSAVSEAYALPKDNARLRTAKIASASADAAIAPLEVMIASVKALKLANLLLGHSNKNLESDIYVAALSLQAGLVSAKYNVEANMPAIGKVSAESVEKLQYMVNNEMMKGLGLANLILTEMG